MITQFGGGGSSTSMTPQESDERAVRSGKLTVLSPLPVPRQL